MNSFNKYCSSMMKNLMEAEEDAAQTDSMPPADSVPPDGSTPPAAPTAPTAPAPAKASRKRYPQWDNNQHEPWEKPDRPPDAFDKRPAKVPEAYLAKFSKRQAAPPPRTFEQDNPSTKIGKRSRAQ
jgi:hypothetical protein